MGIWNREIPDNFILLDESLTAAGTPDEYRSGAMIALIPRDEDIAKLVVDNGITPDDIHLTLFYLGESDEIPDEMKTQLLDRLMENDHDFTNSTIDANVFSINFFNPLDTPCMVLGVGGNALDEMHRDIQFVLDEIGFNLSESKKPWVPHITLMYGDCSNINVMDVAKSRIGDVVFDRLRVQFGQETHNIKLSD